MATADPSTLTTDAAADVDADVDHDTALMTDLSDGTNTLYVPADHAPVDNAERRWQLMLGVDDTGQCAPLSADDQRLAAALAALYDAGSGGESQSGRYGGRRGGLGRSAPKVAAWLGDVRRYFPSSVVQVVQQDAFERLGLKQMLLEPEFLAAMQADVHLVADLISLRGAMPEKTLATARQVVQQVVDELMARLASRTTEAVRGALNKSRRTHRPRFADIDWPRTIAANLRHYQADLGTIVPERLVGYARSHRRAADLERVVLCVDQSGSMASSVVYSAIFAAVLASIPSVATQLVCFDTAILDLTDELADPVQVLFGVQLGGGTDINQALAYCQARITQPTLTHLVLISDLFEGGNAAEMLARAAELVRQGVNVICLLALSDDGRPCYDAQMAAKMATLGAPVFACTPDQFPDLMATALNRGDVLAWAADQGIACVRPDV